jgi:hypothetical protein
LKLKFLILRIDKQVFVSLACSLLKSLSKHTLLLHGTNAIPTNRFQHDEKAAIADVVPSEARGREEGMVQKRETNLEREKRACLTS